MDFIAVGIDVSKDHLDIAVRPGGEAFTVERNAAGVEQLAERLRTLSPHVVALEATGGFETVAAATLAAAGLPVVIVNPAQVRAFAKAIGQRAKTDPIDAAVIAHFAEATKPQVRPLPDEATRLLADLVARRRQIVEMIGAERQRCEADDDSAPAQEHRASDQGALEKELAGLDTISTTRCVARQSGARRKTCSVSVPGVGPIIASTLIAELPELGTLRSQADRSLGRARPVHASIRPVAWQELHRRRPASRADRPVHGRHGGQTAQSRAEGLLRSPRRRR